LYGRKRGLQSAAPLQAFPVSRKFAIPVALTEWGENASDNPASLSRDAGTKSENQKLADRMISKRSARSCCRWGHKNSNISWSLQGRIGNERWNLEGFGFLKDQRSL
jgi:hypothetical protein